MSILLTDLIEKLPSDTQRPREGSQGAFQRQGPRGLRRETRLGLNRHQEDLFGGRDDVMSVPITICPGLPEASTPLDRHTIDDRHSLSVLLSPYRQMMAVRDYGED